jgi:predicted AlkP superfamily phosphohydrolase/phosphomutase
VLAIGLDGFELSLAERLMAEGALPNIEQLHARSVRYRLEHGRDKYSGLAWEHVSSGRAPSDGGRWSAVTFHSSDYTVRQDPTFARPFLADISARTVVFDPPYFDLHQAPRVLGLTSWGAHDPGVMPAARPEGLREELARMFGPYPASDWIYGFTWPSPERTRMLGEALVRAVEVRTRATRWLLAERLPDWDLALVVVSETHSAIEPLWHGVDASHPLHGIASAAVAAEGLRNVYRAVDDLVGELCREFPDAIVALFAMHGMGANEADVPSMLLLPELLYRHAFGKPYMRLPRWEAETAAGVPLLAADETWEAVMQRAVPVPAAPAGLLAHRVGRMLGFAQPVPIAKAAPDPAKLEWMPATNYREFWPRMPAFALPSFYDGRVRINVAGREGRGIVSREGYVTACDQISDLLLGCRNALTGEAVVDAIHKEHSDPSRVGPSEADLYVIWRSLPVGFASPLGTIGPVPYRRTGGHTEAWGFLYIAGNDVTPRDAGCAGSFDVVPTLLDLVGEARPPGLSGTPLASRLEASS